MTPIGGKSVKTNASKVARQYRLQQWAEQIRECNNRSPESSVKDWCAHHNISTANYYYKKYQCKIVKIKTQVIFEPTTPSTSATSL